MFLLCPFLLMFFRGFSFYICFPCSTTSTSFLSVNVFHVSLVQCFFHFPFHFVFNKNKFKSHFFSGVLFPIVYSLLLLNICQCFFVCFHCFLVFVFFQYLSTFSDPFVFSCVFLPLGFSHFCFLFFRNFLTFHLRPLFLEPFTLVPRFHYSKNEMFSTCSSFRLCCICLLLVSHCCTSCLYPSSPAPLFFSASPLSFLASFFSFFFEMFFLCVHVLTFALFGSLSFFLCFSFFHVFPSNVFVLFSNVHLFYNFPSVHDYFPMIHEKTCFCTLCFSCFQFDFQLFCRIFSCFCFYHVFCFYQTFKLSPLFHLLIVSHFVVSALTIFCIFLPFYHLCCSSFFHFPMFQIGQPVQNCAIFFVNIDIDMDRDEEKESGQGHRERNCNRGRKNRKKNRNGNR